MHTSDLADLDSIIAGRVSPKRHHLAHHHPVDPLHHSSPSVQTFGSKLDPRPPAHSDHHAQLLVHRSGEQAADYLQVDQVVFRLGQEDGASDVVVPGAEVLSVEHQLLVAGQELLVQRGVAEEVD